MSTLGERIKSLRIDHHVTQQELADSVNIKRATLANWEINRTEPGYDSLCKIADRFDVSVDYLLGRTNDAMSIVAESSERYYTIDELICLALGSDSPPTQAIEEVKAAIEYARRKYNLV